MSSRFGVCRTHNILHFSFLQVISLINQAQVEAKGHKLTCLNQVSAADIIFILKMATLMLKVIIYQISDMHC